MLPSLLLLFFSLISGHVFVSFRFIFGNNIVCHDNNKSRGRNGTDFGVGFGFGLVFGVSGLGMFLSRARGLNLRSEPSFCNLSQLLGVGMPGGRGFGFGNGTPYMYMEDIGAGKVSECLDGDGRENDDGYGDVDGDVDVEVDVDVDKNQN